MWLMAFVLPLQGTAVGVFSALGPAHIHQSTELRLVLDDVRRWRPTPVAAPPAYAAALAWVGRSHPDAAPRRHHHAADDASVLRTEAHGPLDSADADEAQGASGLSALSALSVLALIPALPVWADATTSNAAAARPPWAMRTGFVDFPHRPPKRA